MLYCLSSLAVLSIYLDFTFPSTYCIILSRFPTFPPHTGRNHQPVSLPFPLLPPAHYLHSKCMYLGTFLLTPNATFLYTPSPPPSVYLFFPFPFSFLSYTIPIHPPTHTKVA
ncbi:hypothetical protein F4775DRAFT_129014 [Biscogniauxia sp. FL1348]|nr:hypothetical protein F4775DRAFT_129014 [Biscogniauxia sp. FL1348]